MRGRPTPSRRSMLAAAGGPLAALVLHVPARAQPLPRVRVGASFDDGLTPVLYALNTGMFSKAGLDVTLTAAQNSAALASAVVGGSVDIGKTALLPLINAHLHGIDLKLVAGAVTYVRGSLDGAICVLRTGPIASLGDVVGKTIALLTLQSLNQMATQASIDQRGGNAASCRFIEMTAGAMLPGLESGRADVAVIPIPVLQADLETGKIRSFGNPYDALGTRLLIAGWFCTQEYATKNPLVVRRFGDTVRAAAGYTNTHRDEIVPMIAAYSGIDAEVLRKTKGSFNATELDPKDIQPAIDAAYKYKYIGTTFDARELIAR